ncbi:MAG: glycosyltransferase family 4 protein [Burkholderiales bacterium]|nr:glycosyltransferase family 4 protein [Burkholderiales bacterium]
MKITIATGPLLPVPAVRGGAIPRMWSGLAAEFVRRQHEVCLVARAFPGQAGGETVDGVRYVRFGGFAQSRSITLDLVRDFGYALSVVWRLPEADILVTNDFWLPVLSARMRRRAGLVVVNANRYPKGQYFLYSGAVRIAAASSAVRAAIAVQSPALADRIRVIPNPVDTAIMYPDKNARVDNPRLLLYVGRLHPEKGVHLLAAAFGRIAPRHPGWRLRIVGPWLPDEGGGGLDYVEELRATLKGVPGEIVGPQFDSALLAKEYRTATLFCYPSLADRGESFGVAALEAMACGTAPLVSSLDCFRDFVTEGRTGWVFDHRAPDPEGALAAALNVAMANPARALEIGQHAADAARKFGYAEVAVSYLADFRELLQRAKRDA